VRALALSGRRDERATRFLLEELARIRSTVEGELRLRKDAALIAMQDAGFWEDDRRYQVLAEAEYLDRLEAAYQTAAKLGERLARYADRSSNGVSELPVLLSLRLHVLQAAIAGIADQRSTDVFVRLRAAASEDDPAVAEWLDDLASMYAAWARRRGMRLERLDPAEHLYAVSGLGAATILLPEAGLHLFEIPEEREGSRADRVHALVQVVPWPPEARDGHSTLDRARALLRQAPATTGVVRRYRASPTPLVRDAVRGYRTGRLDRVLAGDFDLF
jgi:ATP-dependent Clp protease ATP-binding subunit ClpC